jgi:hypothetical protein
LEIRRLNCKGRDAEKVRYTLCNEDENFVRILMKCNGTHRWREQFLNNEWLHINTKIPSKEMTNCNNNNNNNNHKSNNGGGGDDDEDNNNNNSNNNNNNQNNNNAEFKNID